MRLHLEADAEPCLQEALQTTPDRRLRHRCQAMLMAARGRRHRLIAEDLGISVRTLQRWLNAYQGGGLAGLTSQWAAGRAPRIPAALAPESLTWVEHGPAGCGLDRANWTYAELAAPRYRTHGIAVSESTMRSFCAQQGVRPYRPTYRYLNADPARQTAARQDLQAFQKSRAGGTRPAESRCGTLLDDSHFAHDSGAQRAPADRRQRGWSRRGPCLRRA
jgi:transposase